VELGKAMGARVIAAASSEEKLALAQENAAPMSGVQYPLGALDKADARALTERFKAACGVRARM
jgi:NADPH2:quinone reductase